MLDNLCEQYCYEFIDFFLEKRVFKQIDFSIIIRLYQSNLYIPDTSVIHLVKKQMIDVQQANPVWTQHVPIAQSRWHRQTPQNE